MSKIFITGGTGVLGTHIIKRLHHEGCDVVALSRNKYIPGCRTVIGNFNTFDRSCLQGCSALIHAAGDIDPLKSYDELYTINAESTRLMVEACEDAEVPLFILISSSSVYGKYNNIRLAEDTPLRSDSPYSRSKYHAETFVKQFKEKYCILRPCGMYGTGYEGKYVSLYRKLNLTYPLLIGKGSNYIPIVHVADVADAVLSALKHKAHGIYNVSHHELITQREFMDFFLDASASNNYKTIPFTVALLLVKAINVMKRIEKKSVIPVEHIYRLGMSRVLNVDKIERELGFRCRVDLHTGLREFLSHVRELASASHSAGNTLQ